MCHQNPVIPAMKIACIGVFTTGTTYLANSRFRAFVKCHFRYFISVALWVENKCWPISVCLHNNNYWAGFKPSLYTLSCLKNAKVGNLIMYNVLVYILFRCFIALNCCISFLVTPNFFMKCSVILERCSLKQTHPQNQKLQISIWYICRSFQCMQYMPSYW